MKKISTTKTIIGSFVLVIIGSALWENIFKNILNFSGKTLLDISTLGIEKYRNDIYVLIARGFYERVSLGILTLAMSILIGVIVGCIIIIFKIRNS